MKYEIKISCHVRPNHPLSNKAIKVAAGKYHRLMQSDKGRDFLEKELGVIAGWGDSKAEFKVGKDSNDGKI